MTDNTLKALLFKHCLKLEATAVAAKRKVGDTMLGVTAAGGADALREIIREAGMEEEYRSFYYSLALKAAGEVLAGAD